VERKTSDREHSEQMRSRWGFRGMTVRDWLQLLIVPLALVLIGFLFTMQQDARQQRTEDQRAQAERRLAEQSAQDEALQAYLDQLSDLLLEKDLRNSEEGSEVRTLARARTATVIQRLDAEGNRNVIRFLNEAGLTKNRRSSIRLLAGVDLQGAQLGGADLGSTDLSYTNLSDADLSGANLLDAKLRGTDLSDADLSDADLKYAYLIEANLSNANLNGADLIEANLSNARGITKEQLEKQTENLKDALMPDKTKHH
jgi:cell division protein FtsB